MSIRDLKVTEQQIREKGVIASPDTLTGTPDENKSVFDRLASEVLVPAVNGALEMLGEVEDDTVEWASDEAARQAAEAARASAEEGRVQAEQGRASAETARAQAENARVSAEQGRESAETARVQAEQGRASAETNRVSAEQGRVSAETGRISAEAARAQAENDREDAEQARALAEQQRADENTGIVARATAQADSAEAAATRAESWAAGGTGTRSGEDTDNAKYYADQAGSAAAAASQDAQSAGSHAGAASGSAEAAAASARTASQDAQSALASKDAAAAAATRAEQAAENAEAIAGGDFIPGSEKGASGGVATLDSAGLLTAAQKPVYTAEEVGALGGKSVYYWNNDGNGNDLMEILCRYPCGVILIGNGYTPSGMTFPAFVVAGSVDRGTVSFLVIDHAGCTWKGSASLSSMTVTSIEKTHDPAEVDDFIEGMEAAAGSPNGIATLDESGKVPARQLPEMDYDPAGSAAAVQEALEGHTADKANPHGVTAAQTGAVPNTRTVNGMTLDADVTLTGEDILTSSTDDSAVSTALAGKASAAEHKMKSFTSLADIGLTAGSETIEAIVNAMPNYSTLTISTGSGNNSSTYPTSAYGQLYVEKISKECVYVRYTIKDTAASYYGYYSTSAAGYTNWSGWIQVGGGFPVGAIVIWSGASTAIPEGWALCNGANGTPDLRDRFIVGAGGSYSVGNTGGENTVTLTVNQMPSHNHSVSACTPTGATGSYISATNSSKNATPVTSTSTGGGQAHENRPPYYALCYIMYTGA